MLILLQETKTNCNKTLWNFKKLHTRCHSTQDKPTKDEVFLASRNHTQSKNVRMPTRYEIVKFSKNKNFTLPTPLFALKP